MIQNYELVYSIDREKLHQLILLEEFVKNIAGNQMFISGEIVYILNNWPVPIMLFNLPIMLLSNAPKIFLLCPVPL